MKKNLILSLCVSALVSCSQTDVLENTPTGVLLTRSTSLETPFYVESDGALNFRSIEDYFQLSDSLISLSESEYRKWATVNHFDSYQTFTDNIIDAIYTAMDNDPSEVTNLLEKNKQYVFMTVDSLVYPVVQSKTYRNILNKDGVFYIGGVKNVVDGRYVTLATTDNFRSVHKIEYLNPISSNMRSEQIIFDKYDYTKKDKTKKTYADCCLIKNTAFEDTHGANQTMVQFQINVDGKRKKLAGWKHYTTAYWVSQITCIFNGIPTELYPNGSIKTYGTKTLSVPAEVSLPEGKSGSYVKNLMDFSVRNMTEPLKSPDCIHFKAGTRGTHPEGAGYNYYKGGYIDSDLCIKNDPSIKDICPIHHNVYSRDVK